MISSRITYLLEQSYGSLTRAMSTGRDSDAPRSGMGRALGLNSLPGFPAAGYFSGSRGGVIHQDTRAFIDLCGNDEPPGLGNWDNSCYQNSVLQGIASLRFIPTYLDSLLSNPSNDVYSAGVSVPTVAALRDFVNELNSPRNSGRLLWTPSVLKSMSSWQQQDAQEYFSNILNQLDKELLRAVEHLRKRNDSGLRPETANTQPSKELLEGHEDSGLQQRPELLLRVKADLHSGHSRSLSAKLRPLPNPLEGFLAQRVGCLQCGWSEGLSMTPFICLTLPLGRGRSFDLESCLDEYTKLEHIEGVECARCTLMRARLQLELLIETSDHENPASLSEDSRTSTRDEFLQSTVLPRLQAITSALDDEDFSENILLNKCKINARNRVTVTKSRQAVIARAPKSLVIHINRSVFDEFSGAQTKNYAHVRFPKILDLGPWCLDFKAGQDMDDHDRILEPARSLLADKQTDSSQESPVYHIRAVVTHYGRHENGHYICYRQYPTGPSNEQDSSTEQYWWQLSDDEVTPVTEEDVLEQGGVFMLFYDRVDNAPYDGNLFVDWPTVSQNETSGLEEYVGLPVEPEASDEASPKSDRSGGEEAALISAQLNEELNRGSRVGSGEETLIDTETQSSEHPEENSATISLPSSPKASSTKTGVYSGVEIKKRNPMAASPISSLIMAN